MSAHPAGDGARHCSARVARRYGRLLAHHRVVLQSHIEEGRQDRRTIRLWVYPGHSSRLFLLKIIAILSWFDESPSWLSACVASLARAGCSHLVAVDGAYRLYPDGRPHSGIAQQDAITR